MRAKMRILSPVAALALVLANAVATADASASSEAAPAGLNLERYRGKVVYVDFWASWCGPCKQSFKFMKGLSSRYPSSDFVIVTVNVDRQRAAADGFLKQQGASLPVVYDTRGEIAKTYKVADMPTSLLIGRDGRLRYRHQGFFPAKEAEYEAHISELVKERS